MSILFSGSELLEVALGIERNGAAFPTGERQQAMDSWALRKKKGSTGSL